MAKKKTVKTTKCDCNCRCNTGKTILKNAWLDLKKGLDQFIVNKDLGEIKETISDVFDSTKEEISCVVGKDIKAAKKILEKEKKAAEAKVNKTLEKELKRARDFVVTQKKNLDKLQEKIECYLPAEKKSTKKTKKK